MTVGAEVVGRIGRGLLVLVGVGKSDTQDDAAYLASKIFGLRIFEDEGGKMNLDVAQVDGEVLIVSQFTLYGDTRRGKRPSFDEAASPPDARRLFDSFVALMRQAGPRCASGRFQETMQVELVNDGPVTLLLDSAR